MVDTLWPNRRNHKWVHDTWTHSMNHRDSNYFKSGLYVNHGKKKKKSLNDINTEENIRIRFHPDW